jgi:hypothetical protein
MAKYSKRAGKKVEKAMHEKKRGQLKTGTGKKVTSRKQAIAIGLSEARAEGAKVPKKKAASKSTTKKASKKAAPKKSAKKSASKSPAKKGTRKAASKKGSRSKSSRTKSASKSKSKK